MQRFREWRESLKSKSDAEKSNHGTSSSSSSASTSSKSTTGSSTRRSFLDIDRARRERHTSLVTILKDPESFASFLRFLPPVQQHELLFICECNQLLEKAETEYEEGEICMEAMKIANIFLRTQETTPPTASTSAIKQSLHSHNLQVESIQPATRVHLLACIPLTLPPHLQASSHAHGSNAYPSTPHAASTSASASSSSSSASAEPYAKTDTKAILTMLEVARDQVEEGISKKSLPKFLELLEHPDKISVITPPTQPVVSAVSTTSSNSSSSMNATANGGLSTPNGLDSDKKVTSPSAHEVSQYSFDDCAYAVTHSHTDGSMMSYVHRAFLLYLMEDKRHRILCFWSEVMYALSLVDEQEFSEDAELTDATIDGNTSSTATADAAVDTDPAASTDASSSASTSSLTFSDLYTLYTILSDAYHKFYPDSVVREPNFFAFKPISFRNLDEENEEDGGNANGNHQQMMITLIDASASPQSLSLLRSHIRDLLQKLRPMSLKMDKILRYTFWPQFMKTENYHKLACVKRPEDVVVSTSGLQAGRENSVNSTTMTTGGSRRGSSSLLNVPSAINTTMATTKKHSPLLPPSSSNPSMSSLYPPLTPSTSSYSLPTSSSSSSIPHNRLKHTLISSLKQQKVTRDMLILECASEEEVERRERKRNEQLHAQTRRLLEYVCVYKSTPILPPRPTSSRHRPPLPPRPNRNNKSTSAAPSASTSPEPILNNPMTPSTSASPPPQVSAPPLIRGKHALSLFYRYPSLDHSSSQLPAQLIDLAFPLVTDDTSCTCDQGRGSEIIQCLKDTTKQEEAKPTVRTSLAESDFYGFPLTQSASAATKASVDSASRSGTPSISSNNPSSSSNPNSRISNRLFNIVCTSESGSLLRGCVLQVVQEEIIEEKWEEAVYTQTEDEISDGNLGIGADVLSRERRKSAERKSTIATNGSDGGITSVPARRPSVGLPPAVSSVAAAATAATAVSSTATTTSTASSPSLQVSTSAPSTSTGTTTTPSSATAKLSLMFDGFAKDVKSLVERVANETSATISNVGANGTKERKNSDPAPAVLPVALPALPSVPEVATPASSATPPPASTANASTSASPIVSPGESSPALAVAGTSGSPSLTSFSTNSLVSFYALPGPASNVSIVPSATASATSSPIYSASGPAGVITTTGSDDPSNSTSTIPSSTSNPLITPPRIRRSARPYVIQHHHRVYKVQTQYAIVLLTQQPLFNLLRSALSNLLRSATSSASTSTSVSPDGRTHAPTSTDESADRMNLRQTIPFHLLEHGSTLYTLLDSSAFYRLLVYTRRPRYALNLFGSHSTLSSTVPQLSPAYLHIPPIDFTYDLLFRCLHPRRFLLIMESLICERRVLLLSSSNSMLTLACECFLSLLYPFTWRYLYIPILPYSLFKYLACPTPFLIGVHSCEREKACELAEKDVVLVDLDHDEVYINETHHRTEQEEQAFFLPNSVREQFLKQAMKLFRPEMSRLDQMMDGVEGEEHANGNGSESDFDPTSILTPEKPSIDTDSHKFIDPYSTAEAPHIMTTQQASSQQHVVEDGEKNKNMLKSSLSEAFSPSSHLRALSLRGGAGGGADSTSSSLASLRAVLLQLEFVKIWSHLLKQYRLFALHLSAPSIGASVSPSDAGILLFDSPAFLETKPDHYIPFLTTLLNTSYFPIFLHDRTQPHGFSSVTNDTFDRYEASLSGTRINVWKCAFEWRVKRGKEREKEKSQEIATAVDEEFDAWLREYEQTGIDPSLHHVSYLVGWRSINQPHQNQQQNHLLQQHQQEKQNPSIQEWKAIERLPIEWWHEDMPAMTSMSAGTATSSPVDEESVSMSPVESSPNTNIEGSATTQMNGTAHSNDDNGSQTSASVPAPVDVSSSSSEVILPTPSFYSATPTTTTTTTTSAATPTSTTPVTPSTPAGEKSTLYRTRRPSNARRSSSGAEAILRAEAALLNSVATNNVHSNVDEVDSAEQ